MGEVIKFFTFDSLYNYVEQQLNAPVDYVSPETSQYWSEIIGDILGKRARAVPKYNSFTGEQSWEWEFETFDSDVVIPGKAYEVPSNTAVTSSSTASAAAASEAIGGGGVKTPPTLTKVVTDNTTGESVLGEDATGLKNIGVGTKVPVQSVITALMAAYGLYSLAITAQNWHTWEDIFNTIFPNALPQDATFEDVKNFAKGKYQLYIGGVIENRTLNVYVPETIVKRMYDYISQHVEEDGTIQGLELNLFWFGQLSGSWSRDSNVSRHFSYVSAGLINNPQIKHVYWQENLVYNWYLDVAQQLIGLGFTVSQSTTNVWLNGCRSISEWITANAPSASVLTYKYVEGTFTFYRRAHVPKSQPVSANELSLSICFYDDTRMVIDANYGVETQVPTSIISPKILKYGRTGENIEDFGYCVLGTSSYGGTQINSYTVEVSFQANEVVCDDYGMGIQPSYEDSYMQYRMNGYCLTALDTDESVPDDSDYDFWQYFVYSNFSYDGEIKNYKPDSTLSAVAGKDDKPGKTKLRPAASSTGMAWDDWYKKWSEQSKKRGTVNNRGQNVLVSDVPVQVPFGDKNADQIINHGYNNPSDNQSYVNNNDQNDNQSGRIPEDTDMDDINDAIEDTVDDYNETRVLPDTAPDPVPDDEPLPNFPETPPSDDQDETDDTPDIPAMPGMTASGMCSVYNPTKEQLKNFSAWLWSLDPLENLKKILSNPVDAIIGLHIMYATPVVTTASNIICGYLDSGVAAPVVTEQFIEIDCGYVDVPEYYGNAIDYEPYTHVNCYLPFVGIVSLKPNDVIGKRVYISYGVDVLTGTCLARIVTKTASSEIQCYTFPGNCSTQIPLTGGNYAQVIRGIASMAVGVAGSVITANPLPAIGGVIGGAMSASLDVSRSGSIGANAGAMGIRKPYLLITRRASYDANSYASYYGYPANMTVRLSTCKGFTRIKSVHIDDMGVATDNEVAEIETLLKQGVIIK